MVDQQKLNSLRGRMAPILELESLLFSDSDLTRFLVAYQWDVDEAQLAIMHYVKWRKQSPNYGVSNVDSITSSTVVEEIKSGKAYVLPETTPAGLPIITCHAKLHHPNQEGYDKDQNTRFIIYTMERAINSMATNVSQVCVIIDLDDLSLDNVDYDFTKRLIYLMTKVYPERMGLCLLLKAPPLFSVAWSAIRPWLNEVTQNKIHFCDTPQDLFKFVPNHLLPASLGGAHPWVYQPQSLLGPVP
eukprot:NODE_6844_length_837_cov_35.717087_g6244_i0.p1 GENE.NODE_6844_length_837_cov_35.717087_g6244_i0~~NODE_6844_length_837_cov_35.717087_g6244_i0.p1  ORF type:complete len:244 (+),score=28.72 NODE_6844_length_837_cov_35.717087_g6244_i0:60-791(+)